MIIIRMMVCMRPTINMGVGRTIAAEGYRDSHMHDVNAIPILQGIILL
jgi:hypothetical protein